MPQGKQEQPGQPDGGSKPADPKHEIAAAIDAFTKRYEAAQQGRPEHDSETLRWTKRAAFGVGIYTVITLGIAIIALCQLHTSRDTEIRQLRAYLIVTDFGVFCPDCGDTALTPNARADIKNSLRSRIENNGQTPALQVIGITNWWPIAGKNGVLASDFAFPDHKRTGFVSKSDIGRDKHKDSAEELDDQAIATFKQAVAGDTTLFLYGHADYCDIFGHPHSTAYCFRYVPNAGLHLPICDRFNGEIEPRGKCENLARP